MGNREDLLDGARRCIIEKGYARTTARDIAGAAGVSLAAIGYHFGSKEALMAEALLGTGIQIGDALDVALRGAPKGELLGRIWDESLRAFGDERELLAASMENLAQIDRIPVVAERLRAAQDAAITASPRCSPTHCHRSTTTSGGRSPPTFRARQRPRRDLADRPVDRAVGRATRAAAAPAWSGRSGCRRGGPESRTRRSFPRKRASRAVRLGASLTSWDD